MSEREPNINLDVPGYISPEKESLIEADDARAQQQIEDLFRQRQQEELHWRLMEELPSKIADSLDYLVPDCVVEVPIHSRTELKDDPRQPINQYPAKYLGGVHYCHRPGASYSKHETFHFALGTDGWLWFNSNGVGARREFTPTLMIVESPYRAIPLGLENPGNVRVDSMNDFIKKTLLEHGNWPQPPATE
jgi:hypothetical protein